MGVSLAKSRVTTGAILFVRLRMLSKSKKSNVSLELVREKRKIVLGERMMRCARLESWKVSDVECGSVPSFYRSRTPWQREAPPPSCPFWWGLCGWWWWGGEQSWEPHLDGWSAERGKPNFLTGPGSVCAWLVAATCCPRAVLCLLKTHPRASPRLLLLLLK